MTTVKAPVRGFSGVVANVKFVDGAGETSDINALNYFRRHGYEVVEVEKPAPAKKTAAKPSPK